MSRAEDRSRILVVDDEEPIRRNLRRLLARGGYECTEAADAAEARRVLAAEDVALMLCDLTMPGESGLELARSILEARKDVAVVMVTGLDDPELARAALEFGAYGYVIKPYRPSEVLINVANALRRRSLEIEHRSHEELLTARVLERTAELQQAITDLEQSERELRESREETIHRLARAAESRDLETGMHIERMKGYSWILANRLGLGSGRAELLRTAAPLHDIGKIGIPDAVLLKPGQLSPEERKQMEAHTEIGYRLLSGSEASLLQLAATLALSHHERFDGSGYPRGLREEEIPIEARIVALADVFDALTSERVYRPAFTLERALETMRQGRGTQFDPELLDAFFAALPEVEELRSRFVDGSLRSPDRTRAA